MHPRDVDHIADPASLRSALRATGMPDFPETTTIRAMKLRYHLAYASLLEDYERAYGSMAIDKSRTVPGRHRRRAEAALSETRRVCARQYPRDAVAHQLYRPGHQEAEWQGIRA